MPDSCCLFPWTGRSPSIGVRGHVEGTGPSSFAGKASSVPSLLEEGGWGTLRISDGINVGCKKV